jgi:isoquinoline 1-oxidoreductase beta subunit
MSAILETKITRRAFLQTTGALTFAFTLGGRATNALAQDGASRFNAWVSIGGDGTITVLVPVAEMGQGAATALPLILAEELDADWSKVTYQWAPPIAKVYGNYHPLFGGAMITAASISTPGYWTSLRLAGAQARRVLLDNVAQQWGVPLSELTTEPSMVVHARSGRRISYGEVVKFAKVPATPPQLTEADLKQPSQFRLIGRADIPRTDVPSKTNGSAKYGIDVRLPGMLYASVLESPYEGAKAVQVNSDEAMKVAGVKRVLTLPFGVAVVADSVHGANKGRRALKVKWDGGGNPNASFDSEKALAEYARHARDPNAKAMTAFEVGNARSALSGAAKTLEAEYSSVHCYHAQMEPMNCVARVAPDGQSAEVWTGTQSNALAAFVASLVLKTTPDKIRVHQHLLGGGYGRRIWPDAVAQAVVIANITKEPIKLVLTREDDLAAARPRPMTYHTIKAGLDGGGNLVAWYHRLVSENVDAVAAPPRFKATGGKDVIGWRGLEQPFYGVPNMLAEAVREQRGVRVHAWRGIGAGYNKFVSESFLDEIAHATGKDPLDIRLQLTRDHPRAQAVIKAVAEMADWKKPRGRDRALGIAFSDYHESFSAGIAEVSLDRKTGRIRVHNYWIAGDAGIVVQPENAHAQLESAVVYGLGSALTEELTYKDGAVQQSNFHDYRLIRMSDMPQIHTKVIVTANAPTGLGELGVPTVAPAIGNAVFKLTGKRLRQLPMSASRVSAALKA